MSAVPKLSVVPSEIPDPPYPSDVRANGWNFQLDLGRITQSDTWVMAPTDMRPWLLMLWAVAWQQSPAGTLPSEDALVAARIGMDPRIFAGNRDALMRGWVLHSDGRLYHSVISSLVLDMCESRRSTRERVAAWRNRSKSEGSGNALPTRDQHVGNTTGSGSGSVSGTGSENKDTPRKRVASVSPKALAADGVDPQVAADWVAIRSAKRLPLTLTAWNSIKEQAAMAGISPADAVRTCVVEGWAGFKADWKTTKSIGHGGRQSAIEAANKAVGSAWAAKGGNHEGV